MKFLFGYYLPHPPEGWHRKANFLESFLWLSAGLHHPRANQSFYKKSEIQEMSIQGKFKLTALAIAMTLPAVVNATNITESTVTNGAGGAMLIFSAIDDVNISLDRN